MMRSLVRTEPESHPAWPSVEKGLEAKRELERCRVNFENSSQVLQMLDGMLERNRDKVREGFSFFPRKMVKSSCVFFSLSFSR